ncbi:MAG: hypothetical protein VZT48_01185 [Bulleidia sp.]|nr:hypothetical protein [Bulleidia sp.]
MMARGEEGFSLLQEQEISQGRQDGLSDSEIAIYARQDFNYRRMGEFRQALKDQLPMELILSAARSSLSDDEVHDLFEDYRASLNPALPKARKKPPWKILAVVSASALALLLAYANLKSHESTAEITLKNSSVRIACGQEFVPKKYVRTTGLSEGEWVEMPEPFIMDKPGKQIVSYRLHTKGEEKQVLLEVEGVDETPPEITLSAEETTVYNAEQFSCEAFLIKAADEIDGDLTNNVACSSTLNEETEQTVVYTVSDRSGNEAQEELLVHLEDVQEAVAEVLEAAPEPTPEPASVPPAPQPVWTPAPYVPPAPAEPVWQDEWVDEVYTYSENISTGADGGSVSIEHSN